MSMVEKVARAICLSLGNNPMSRWEGDDGTTLWGWETYTPAARAAIEAMRDATKEMYEIGATASDDAHDYSRGSDGWEDYWNNDQVAADVWKAMISAALESE